MIKQDLIQRVVERTGLPRTKAEDAVDTIFDSMKKTLIAGTDPVALDAYAAKAYWDLDWHTLRYLKLASERHLGTLSFENVRTRFVAL